MDWAPSPTPPRRARAGLLWDRFGATVTFHAGAIFSPAVLVMLMLSRLSE